MSKLICVMGESGSGKTTSMRNLDPAKTFYFDCDKKGLSWKGWRKQYSVENKNYFQTSSAPAIIKAIKNISDQRPETSVIVIDTLNWIMLDDEIKRMSEKGFDKWQDLAQAVISIIRTASMLRDDLTVIFIAHTQVDRDDSGNIVNIRIKTSGRKLDKICLESLFPVVLLSKGNNGKYLYEVHSKNSTAKTPLGAFSEDEIDNDITKVLEILEEY